MTDTPKDRDMDEAVGAMAEELIGVDVGYAEQREDIARDILTALRSSGYIVARPVAAEGLREAVLAKLAKIQSECVPWECTAFVASEIVALLHAREAALRAEIAKLREDVKKSFVQTSHWAQQAGEFKAERDAARAATGAER